MAKGAAARVELAVWLGLAALAFALTFEFSGEAGTYAWGAASWPRAVILLMAVFALLQYARRGPQVDRQAPQAAPAFELVMSAGALILPLAYIFLLPRTGFYIATPLFVLLYLLLLGERRPGPLVAVPVLVFAVITVVFTRLFYVALPTGNWPGFYELNNAFVGLIR